ncbi:MAG TPA: Na-translocating system protein MpsB, partial [Planctomycetaceae bacterium]|nr:Na-translocating system protein MpsB [Planctomycetaceae bacterium]
MSELRFEPTPDSDSNATALMAENQHDDRARLSDVLAELHSIVPPLWPLRHYVAVNPFLGLSGKSFLDARQLLCGVRDCDLLMPRTYFQSLLESEHVTEQDITAALQQCRCEYPEVFTDVKTKDVTSWLANELTEPDGERTIRTMAEVIDRAEESTWNSHIVNDISRYVSAHYDEGQAIWSSPWRALPLYEAWRETAVVSRRMEQLGIIGFRSFVSQLPKSPLKAISEMLQLLEVPRSAWRPFLLCEIFSVIGWASYVRFTGWNPAAPPQVNEDLIGLLAIRLAYDVALLRCHDVAWPETSWPGEQNPTPTLLPPMDVQARYCLQVAAEIAYRSSLCSAISQNATPHSAETTKTLQMVFCIDVRSEVFRRNLESVDQSIETFGFAGFFGMPFEYVPLGASSGAAQCPVLLSPGFKI